MRPKKHNGKINRHGRKAVKLAAKRLLVGSPSLKGTAKPGFWPRGHYMQA